MPLSQSNTIAKELGTRHRAAIGITEKSDAVVIIVSEETGNISVAENGVINRYFDEESLTIRLRNEISEKGLKKMNSFLEKLKKFDDKSDNKLIILSIIVAVVMWTFVTTSTNPTANRTFRNLPLIIQNQDKLEDNGYTIVSKDEANTVSVRLTGSRNNLIGLDQSDIQASINVANVKEGINSLDVNIDTPTGIYVDHIDPKSINLNIQRIITKSMPVNIVIDDKLKDGKLVEVNEQRPKEIQISGPESIINKVDRIEAYINDAEYLDGKIHNVNVNVLDKGGKTVEGVDLDHKDINLSFLVYETKK